MHPFLHFSRAKDVLSYVKYLQSPLQREGFCGSPGKQSSQIEILCVTILLVFSQFLWNLKFLFLGSHLKMSLILLQITSYIYSAPLKSVKKNVIWLEISWYKIFVHWKLQLLNFLVACEQQTYFRLSFLSFGGREATDGNTPAVRRLISWWIPMGLVLYFFFR